MSSFSRDAGADQGGAMQVFTTAEMRMQGFSEARLRDAVAAGRVRKIRRDRYCAPDADPAAVEAIRIGGVLGCVSALRAFGVWVPPSPTVHVHLPPNAARLRPGSAVRHWNDLVEPTDRSTVSALDAVLTSMRCQSTLDAISAIDSALNLGLIRPSQLRPHLDGRGRDLFELSDGRAQSGLETHVRVPVRRLGLRVEPQGRIPGGGRGDLIVEGCVLVETDGAEFHAGPRRHIDHLRDTAATIGGMTALRFDRMQVIYELESVIRAIIEALGQHTRSGFSGRRLGALRDRVGPGLWA